MSRWRARATSATTTTSTPTTTTSTPTPTTPTSIPTSSTPTSTTATATARTDTRVDGLFFLLGGVAAVWLSYLLFRESFSLGWGQVWFSIVYWGLLAYLVLPRLHRILTSIYVPPYFIGRARTSDGLLGDPVNVAFLGSEEHVHEAMTRAGWVRADDLALATGGRIVRATLTRRSYAEAPVSPLTLFDRRQDFAYQQEVDGTPGKRHHVRFWRCPAGWKLPGGRSTDWLAAGTYDRSVGLSLFTLQVTHKIEARTDTERDHIVATITAAIPSVRVDTIEDFSTGYHARNGGGDSIQTDGDLPVVDLAHIPVDPANTLPIPTDSRDVRPAQTVVAAILVGARAIVALSTVAVVLLSWNSVLPGVEWDPEADVGAATSSGQATLWVVTAAIAAFGLAEAVIAWRVYLGANWARVVAMTLSTVSIAAQAAGQAVGQAAGAAALTLDTTITGLSLDVLLLLALSSDRAREYARRPHKAKKRVSGRR
ncbi:LssY-like putative type I secretion system component LssY [Glaciihabitans tibetensis]|uniref:LssY-like putative type I secretion system component LssY n=1 Tax=Glaciihabitans tibetensis TaxID=1266600 RepID=A0A2T0VG68_9MICO|nr:LssY C-terminal domain-containing protein [Glaciihabitans tibetensis]PRY69209.1 LssY-like putative type I secretion system component LssY [Glaciihabitans tibetensis]